MKSKQFLKKVLLSGMVLFLVQFTQAQKQWTAQWVSSPDAKNEANTWVCFRKDISLEKVPKKELAAIAADSKYWLWINGEMIVFDGGLKRGLSPDNAYYDEIDLAPQPGALTSASAKVESVQGAIELAFSNQPESFEMEVTVPANTSALIKLPSGDFTDIKYNGQEIWKNGAWLKKSGSKLVSFTAKEGQLEAKSGKWSFKATK